MPARRATLTPTLSRQREREQDQNGASSRVAFLMMRFLPGSTLPAVSSGLAGSGCGLTYAFFAATFFVAFFAGFSAGVFFAAGAVFLALAALRGRAVRAVFAAEGVDLPHAPGDQKRAVRDCLKAHLPDLPRR